MLKHRVSIVAAFVLGSATRVLLLFSFLSPSPPPPLLQLDGTTDRVSCFEETASMDFPVHLTRIMAQHPFMFTVLDPTRDTAISKHILDYNTWDVHVLKALETLAADACAGDNAMVMDVGANLGFFTTALLAMGCRVTSFEMQHFMAQMVRLNACVNGYADRLTLHEGAVSKETGSLNMVHSDRGNLGGVGIVAHSDRSVVSRRIDELMDLNTTVVVMKMDIEGHENLAMEGMERMFQRRLVKNIVLEFTPTVMGYAEAGEMLQNLYNHGFTKITAIEHMYPKEYHSQLKLVPVRTDRPNWAANYAHFIYKGGDSRGERFLDLLLTLE